MSPLILPLLAIAEKIFDKVVPDKAAEAKAEFQLMVAAQEQDFNLAVKQVETNIEEAKHPSMWVAGWRPAIGWSCAAALFYQFLGYPLMNWFIEIYKPDFVAPVIETESLMELTLAMLGMAGLRSWEKLKGIARK